MPGLTEVLAGIAERRGHRATELPAVALSVTFDPDVDLDDPQTLARQVAIIEPVVHPDLEALLNATSANRRGRFSWAFGLGEDCDPTALRVVMDNVAPGLVYAKSSAENARGPNDLEAVTYGRQADPLRMVARGPAGHLMTNDRLTRMTQPWFAKPPGIVTISSDGRVMWISIRTYQLGPSEEYRGVAEIPLNLRPAGKAALDPKRQVAAEVVTVVDWARATGIEVIETPELNKLERLAARNVAAWPTRGRPAEATASVGRFVDPSVRSLLGVGTIESHRTLELLDVDATDLAALAGNAAGIHPGVADVAAMTAAAPVDDDRLKSYQAEIVGLHLATALGYVNALPTGMGKTITTLGAHQRRAAAKPGWRGLVIVEANVRKQWTDQAAEWFPEAKVVTVVSRSDDATLREALATAGDQPVLAICSYALASDSAQAEQVTAPVTPSEPIESVSKPRKRRLSQGQMALFDIVDGRTWIDAVAAGNTSAGLGATLLGVRWDDIVADEAMGLRNTGTKLATALWRLRSNSEVATALTGTPINKGLDDLGRLLAWVRNDADLFRGRRLDKEFDLSDDDSLDAYLRALGPLVVRRDKSELEGEIPELNTEVVRLTPTRAEKMLATAAREELKRVFDELVAWMTFAENNREGVEAEELASARDALVAARGAWLGGTTLARMAASDPEALLGSGSSGAALLASQGLIADACDEGGTKRNWCVQYCTKRAAAGDRILIFTDFSSAARGLIDDLTEAGVSVGAVLGGGGKARDRDIDAFRNGDLSVLVCTSAGERGLNLQVANVLIHYDLRWTPDAVVQRTGRAQRLGSNVDVVDVIFPTMTGTIEERVAALVVARAMTSMRALDTSRGIAAGDTELGRALGDLALDVDVSEVNGKEAAMLTMTRELLAA